MKDKEDLNEEEPVPYKDEMTALRAAHAILVKSIYRHHGSPSFTGAMLHAMHASMMDFEIKFLAEMNKLAQSEHDKSEGGGTKTVSKDTK